MTHSRAPGQSVRVGDRRVAGVQLSRVLQEVGILPQARFVVFHTVGSGDRRWSSGLSGP